MPLFGSIEAGGTKFRCAVAETPGHFLAEAAFPTTTPAQTLSAIKTFFDAAVAVHGKLRAVGVGSFGPLDLDPASPTHGSIVRTPKPHWSGFPLKAELADRLGCPVTLDTDVNASGLAEALLGAGAGRKSLAYITVGTGIGGALILDRRPLHGFAHPEMGHIRPRRDPADTFAGICPFHGDCLEGLASGAAIFARAGCHLADIPAGDPIWTFLPDYLGQLCTTLLLAAAPNRIVLGGGVMSSNPALFPPIRYAVGTQLAHYCGPLALDEIIVPPGLADHAGLVGGLLLAGSTP